MLQQHQTVLNALGVWQVVADYTRQGAASVMNLTAIPVRFSCWSNLVVRWVNSHNYVSMHDEGADKEQ